MACSSCAAKRAAAKKRLEQQNTAIQSGKAVFKSASGKLFKPRVRKAIPVKAVKTK